MQTICGATFVFDHGGEPDLIGNELTNGAYRVLVGRAPPGEGPPMHIHPHTDEGFYIGEGEMTFVFPDREVVAGPAPSFSCRGASNTPRTSQGRCAACSSARQATPSTSRRSSPRMVAAVVQVTRARAEPSAGLDDER